MDDVAFSFVMLDNSMVCRDQAFSFRFTAWGELLASAPCHAVKNDARSVLCHLAILVDDSSCMPGVVDQLASSFTALGKETLGLGGVLCTGFEAPGLEEIQKVAFFRGMACKHMHRAVLGVCPVATMWDAVNSVFVLEAGDVEGEICRGSVAVDVVVPVRSGSTAQEALGLLQGCRRW